MAKTIPKNSPSDITYIIINGKKNDDNQIILQSPSYVYGYLTLINHKAILKRNVIDKDKIIGAELITLHDMLSIIKSKKIIVDSYWQNILPAIKLFANDDEKVLQMIKNNKANNNNDEVLSI